MERCFYIDTPIGQLKVYAKSDTDHPDDYPGVYIDIVSPDNPGNSEMLCCVEYESIGNHLQTCVYQPYKDEPVAIIEQIALPCLRSAFDRIVNKYDGDPDALGDIYTDFADAVMNENLCEKSILWSDGEMLLTPSMKIANLIADWLDELGATAQTGYFDPKLDEQYGDTDIYTGNWYIDI